MKKIVLQSITLRNWRGAADYTANFHTDAPTTIIGDNGTGKSRHFDAFMWLLFGKDVLGRKDHEVRTRDDAGVYIHNVECSVEATLLIDGTPLTLKREFKEKWVKPTGQVAEVLKGNETVCTWNGTPVKVNDYTKRVQEQIIDGTLFKMLTNPRYFLEKMSWQQQRECLLQMAGTLSDEETAATSPDFQLLLDTIKGKSLADYRKEINVEKKRLKASIAEIQPRIDQTDKMKPEAEDWTALQQQLDDANARLADIDKQTSDALARRNAVNEKHKAKQQAIYDLQAKQRAAIEEYRKQQEALVFEANAARRDIEAKLKKANSESSELSIDRKRTDDRIAYLRREIDNLDKQLSELRKEWHEINASAYDGSDICPHCGQRLPADQIEKAAQKFSEHKKSLLAMNNERGKALSAQRKGLSQELTEKDAEAAKLAQMYNDKDNELNALYEDLKDHPQAIAKHFANNEVPQYVELQQEIEAIEAEQHTADDDTTILADLNTNRVLALSEIDDVKRHLANREQIEKADKEIARLKDEGKQLAQQLADVEKREFVAAQFSKKKIEDCEQRINGLFSFVKFQLFDYTQEGNEYETCAAYIDGTPYTTKNTAGQVNAGLDIINTLCHFHNVSAPIFIDGAESVTSYNETPSQTIYLHVVKGAKLTIQ